MLAPLAVIAAAALLLASSNFVGRSEAPAPDGGRAGEEASSTSAPASVAPPTDDADLAIAPTTRDDVRVADARLSGRVPLDGRGVADVEVLLIGLAGRPIDRDLPILDRFVRETVTTASDGRYAFPRLATGSYKLQARAAGGAHATHAHVLRVGDAWREPAEAIRSRGRRPVVIDFVGDEERATLDLTLVAAGHVTGTVRTEAGTPLAGATVVAIDEDDLGGFDVALMLLGDSAPRTTSAPDGTFTLGGLLGPIRAAARADGRFAQSVQLTLGEGENAPHHFVLATRAEWLTEGAVLSTGADVYFDHESQTNLYGPDARSAARVRSGSRRRRRETRSASSPAGRRPSRRTSYPLTPTSPSRRPPR